MVKLQKHFSYKYKEKEHYKHLVTIPQSAISELGWNEGQQLIFVINNNTLIIKPTPDKGGDKK